MKGKPWTVEEEKRLRELVEVGKNLKEIVAELKKSKESVRMKLRRLGLEVVDHVEKTCWSTSTLVVPKDLPSIEYQLRVLAGVIKKLQEDDLDKVDVMRLGRLIAGVDKYKELYAAYVGYREIEQKVDYAIEWMKKRDEERKNLDRVKGATK